MKKFIGIIFLLFGITFSLTSFGVEEKKSIAVFSLNSPNNASSYAIYSGTQDMFAADLVNSLQTYSDVDVLDLNTAEKIIQASGLQKEYNKLVKQYREKYVIDYEKTDTIAQTLGVNYIVFVYGGFDTEKDFLKSNWKYRCQWIWANPVKPSAELNINATLIDVAKHSYVLEENLKKDISMDNFQKPSSAFGENMVPVSNIKKFSKPNAQKLARKIHTVIYPDLKGKYSQRDAFVDKFTPNNGVMSDYNESPIMEKTINNPRLDKYKDWIQQKI